MSLSNLFFLSLSFCSCCFVLHEWIYDSFNLIVIAPLQSHSSWFQRILKCHFLPNSFTRWLLFDMPLFPHSDVFAWISIFSFSTFWIKTASYINMGNTNRISRTGMKSDGQKSNLLNWNAFSIRAKTTQYTYIPQGRYWCCQEVGWGASHWTSHSF